MLRGRNVVVVSTIAWDFLWQGHQAISTILARHGNRVLFVETTGVRTPGWQDRGRIVDRLRKWLDGRGRFAEIEPNLFLYAPMALPFPYSRLAQRFNRASVGPAIARWVDGGKGSELVLFSFLPTQLTLDLMDTLRPAASVFYCSDKLSETSAEARQLIPYEKQVLERSDLVFASAEKLLEHCRRFNADTHFVSTGVSLEKFEAAWNGAGPPPADLVGLPRPIIGQVGGIRKCVDQPLLEDMTLRFPTATFVFVGPEQVSVGRLKDRPNVRWLGTKPHHEIPSYIREFDVCLIPYVVDAFSDHISPAKLNEYLALGKPIVATNLHEVRRFVEAHGEVVAIAADAAEFAARIDAALHDSSRERRLQRRAVAAGHSWELKVEEMSQRIEAKLRARKPSGHAMLHE